jgi:hypothetical protein
VTPAEGGSTGVYARRYDAAGVAGYENELASTRGNGGLYDPDVALADDGTMVATWTGEYRAVDPTEVWGERFAANGVGGGVFAVSSQAFAGFHSGSAVTMDAAGGFVVAFTTPWPNAGVFARRFGPGGTPLGPDLEVIEVPDGSRVYGVNIAGAPDGRFVVASADGATEKDVRLLARWYDAAGAPATGPVLVAAPVAPAPGTVGPGRPGVAMDAGGDTVAAWRGEPKDNPGIFARRYVEDRRPVVGALTDSPDLLLSGRPVTLTTSGVSAPGGGAIDSVSFYRESNAVPGFQGGAGGDVLLGTVTSAPYTFVAPTTGLAPGPYTYYAVARDARGATGEAASTVNDLFAGPGAPPAVGQVYLDSTKWTPAFRQALSDRGLGGTGFGFTVPGGAGQLAPVPFGPVDRISVLFTEDVTVGPASLAAVRGANGASYLSAATPPGFSYDPNYFIATWTLARPITADRVHLVFDDSRQNGVYDFSGAALDGEWSDGADAYPSGNGTAGGTFRFGFNVLQGDVNRNGRVDAQDFIEVRRRKYNPAFPNPARYSVFADVDGSGRIDLIDLVIVRNRLGRRLPAATAAGTSDLLSS